MLEPVASTDFRSRVAEFYRARGYQVRENCRVRGQSERVYAVDMVSQGPLGNLLVSFGDAGGVDAMEIARVRQVAKDLGATPVMAAPDMDLDMRQLAAQMAVVIVDESALRAPGDGVPMIGGQRKDEAFFEHPWPESGRADSDTSEPEAPPSPEDWPSGEVLTEVVPPGASGKFGWLAPTKAPQATKKDPTPQHEPTVHPHLREDPAASGVSDQAFPVSSSRTARPAPESEPVATTDTRRPVEPLHIDPRIRPTAQTIAHLPDPLAGIEDNLPQAPAPRMHDVDAAEPELQPIEVETTLLSRKATTMERAQRMGDQHLLWLVLMGLVAATGVYIAVLVWP